MTANHPLESALTQSADHCDHRRILATAVTALEAILFQMCDLSAVDPWVERIDQLLDSRPDLLTSAEADRLAHLIFAALTMRHPDHPRIEQWKTRVYAIFDAHDDPSLRILCGFSLFVNGHWNGARGGMHHFCQMLRKLAASPKAAPKARIVERLVTVWYLSLRGAVAESLVALEEGLDLAERSNVHVWDGLLFVQAAAGALNEGDTGTAGALLARMEARLDDLTPLDRIHFHHFRAWHALLEHDLGNALFHQGRSLAGATKPGMYNRIEATSHFGMAVILHEKGETATAREHLNRCREIGRRINNRDLGYICDLTEAHIALDAGEQGEAAEYLRSAMKVGRELGFLKFTYWRPEVMARLCCISLEEEIAVDFVGQMIRHFDLFPATPPWHIENWPWMVEVRTLGGFALRVDGKEVTFSAKSPKKALELLKALIVFGPSPSEGFLADLLWPQAEGDASIRSLEVTLHRLRKIFREGTLIRRTAGKILIDRRRVFVDAWVIVACFEEEFAAEDEQLTKNCHRLIALYQGPFLQGENEGWALPFRQKMWQRYLQGVMTLGRRCEARQFYDEAAALYLQALEHEPRAEILYHRLIACYLQAERRLEALDLFQRYKTILADLGLVPDQATTALVCSQLPSK